jgi:hypothetical protein
MDDERELFCEWSLHPIVKPDTYKNYSEEVSIYRTIYMATVSNTEISRVKVDKRFPTKSSLPYEQFIRLLKFYPRNASDNINCTLRQTKLENAPKYEAISRVGDRNRN